MTPILVHAKNAQLGVKIVNLMQHHDLHAGTFSQIMFLTFHLMHEDLVVHAAQIVILMLQQTHAQLVIQFVQLAQVLLQLNVYHVLKLRVVNNCTMNRIQMNVYSAVAGLMLRMIVQILEKEALLILYLSQL